MNETLHIADLDFEVRRGPRRKTLGLTVDRGGELVVHAPHTTTQEEMRKWVQCKLLWVHRKLAEKHEMNSAIRTPEFVSGESFYYLGKSYRLKVTRKAAVPLTLRNGWFQLDEAELANAVKHFRQWYISTGQPWLRKRVAIWEPRLNAKTSRITVSDLGYRWGSCGKNGTAYFNWRLLQLPIRLIDYVIVHELAHLLQHNHSPEFWRILDRALPDWRNRKEAMEAGWQRYTAFQIDAVV